MSNQIATQSKWYDIQLQPVNADQLTVSNHITEILKAVDKLCIDHNVEEGGVKYLTGELNKISQFIGHQTDNPVEALQMLVIINDIASLLAAVGDDYKSIKQINKK